MASGGEDNFADAIEDDDFSITDDFADNKAKEIQENISQAMALHFTKLESEVNDMFNQRMATIETNLTTQLSEKVVIAQEDVLKTNKIFREISRPLGARWKELFEILMAELPRDRLEQEISTIQKQNTLMQPYKSLMTWKELKGNKFKVSDLIPALKSLELTALLETVERILYHDTKDDLFNLSSVKKTNDEDVKDKKFTSSKDRVLKIKADPPLNYQCTPESMKPTTTKIDKTNSPTVSITPNESLDDRHLLLLARRLKSEWIELAVLLGVDESDISDLKASDDPSGYQSAFKMLWNWREAKNGTTESEICLQILTEGLKKVGKSDLITLLKS